MSEYIDQCEEEGGVDDSLPSRSFVEKPNSLMPSTSFRPLQHDASCHEETVNTLVKVQRHHQYISDFR